MKFQMIKLWLMLPVALAGAIVGGLTVGRSTARAETPAKTAAVKPKAGAELKRNLTFTRDIAPIMNQNCTVCHRAGEVAPFTLASYKDMQKRAQQIALVTSKRIMPPWKADSHGEFQDERRLTDAQIAIVQEWVKQGAKEGNPADLPPAPQFAAGWSLGAPDMVAQPPAEFKVGAEGRDVYRCYVVPTNFIEDRWVSAIDVHPGNRAVVHHIIAYVDTTGKAKRLNAEAKDTELGPGYTTGGGIGFMPSGMLGGWAPGAMPHRLPADTGILLPKGSDIVLEVHYHKNGKSESDRSQVAVYFNKGEVDHPFRIVPLLQHNLNLQPGASNQEVRFDLPIPVPANTTLMTVFPHMHMLGRNMTVTADLPDGAKKTLIDVPDWDFNWQGFYYYKQPVRLPAGSKLHLVAHYDNSTGNPRNPSSPPKLTHWGEQTTDEMCLCYLGFTIDAEHAAKSAKTETPKIADKAAGAQ